jgi:hypothetical protein
MQNADDLQRFGLVPVDNQVRVDEKKPVPLIRQFFAPMAYSRVLCHSGHGLVQRIKNAASMLSSAM